jgi:uncharacterized phosphosugar-binding protein
MRTAEAILDWQAAIAERNADVLDAAADMVVIRIERDGILFAGGAGHSLAAVCEAFYRAGGLVPVRPLYHPRLLPLVDAWDSTMAEREPGLAEDVVSAAEPGPCDLLVVFSNSGSNPYPVELAGAFVVRELPVIAFTSLEASAGAPARADARLAEVADVVIDTGVPPGDVSYPPDGPQTVPLSTLGNAFAWSLLLARVHDRALERGTALPLWSSANVPGGDEANAALLRRYAGRIPELGVAAGDASSTNGR